MACRLRVVAVLSLLLLLAVGATSVAGLPERFFPSSSLSSSVLSSLAGCTIPSDWNATVVGRSHLNLFAVLTAPYCQFISSALPSTDDYFIYSLDVRTGQEVWRWNCSAELCDEWLDAEGAVVPSPTSLGRLYLSVNTVNTTEGTACDVLHALDASTGLTQWSDALCGSRAAVANSIRAVLPFPLDSLPAGQEVVLHMMGDGGNGSPSLLHALNASTGQLLWSAEVPSVRWSAREPLNSGVDGLFTLLSQEGGGTEAVYQIHPNGSVQLVAPSSIAFSPSKRPYLRLAAQPSLVADNGISAYDVVSGSVMWTSHEPFLVGLSWGDNATFAHFSTDYRTLSSQPELFLVVNTAVSRRDPVVLMTQLAVYELRTGRNVSLSPLFVLTHLTHPQANPTTWDFLADDVLAVRADSQWLMLDLPQLTVRTRGHYASTDQGETSNEWLVNTDGSYIAVPYDNHQGLVQGFTPRQDRPMEGSSSTSPAPHLTSGSTSSPSAGAASAGETSTPSSTAAALTSSPDGQSSGGSHSTGGSGGSGGSGGDCTGHSSLVALVGVGADESTGHRSDGCGVCAVGVLARSGVLGVEEEEGWADVDCH